MPELWLHIVKFLPPSSMAIFKQTSNLGRQSTKSLLAGRIIVATGRSAFIFDTATNKLLLTIKGHNLIVRRCKFSRDGRRVMTASADGTAKIWNSVTGTLLLKLTGHTSGLSSCDFSPDGSRIVTGSDDSTVRVWDAENGELLLTLYHLSSVSRCVFSLDGNRIVTISHNDFMARVWCTETGACQLNLEGEHTRPLTCCCFSNDGKYILTSSFDKTARLWNGANGELEKTLLHENCVMSCAFSSNDKLILSVCSGGEMRTWDRQSGISKRKLKVNIGMAFDSCLFTDDIRVISVSCGRASRIWDTYTGDVLSVHTFKHPVLSCDFSNHIEEEKGFNYTLGC